MSLKSRIETVLFVIARSVTIKEIAEILHEEESDIEEAMLDLIMDYSSRDGALEINDENGYILQVKEDYSDIVEKLCPVELSGAILKTLTITILRRLSILSQSPLKRQSLLLTLNQMIISKYSPYHLMNT